FDVFTNSLFDAYVFESFWKRRQTIEFKHLIVHLKGHSHGPVGKFTEIEVVEGLASCHHEMIGSNFSCNADYIIQSGLIQHKFPSKCKRGISELDNSLCIAWG